MQAGSRTILVTMTYPVVNEYLDSSTIIVLRSAYELYKQADLASDLVSHFRRLSTAAADRGGRDLPQTVAFRDLVVERREGRSHRRADESCECRPARV